MCIHDIHESWNQLKTNVPGASTHLIHKNLQIRVWYYRIARARSYYDVYLMSNVYSPTGCHVHSLKFFANYLANVSRFKVYNHLVMHINNKDYTIYWLRESLQRLDNGKSVA